MSDQAGSEFPVTSDTITIVTTSEATVVSTTAAVNMFCVLNTSDTQESYVGIYDTQAAAESATVDEQYHLDSQEQLMFMSAFVSNADPGVSRTVYAVASTPGKQDHDQMGVVITPMTAG